MATDKDAKIAELVAAHAKFEAEHVRSCISFEQEYIMMERRRVLKDQIQAILDAE
jgi:hypothetical protein